MGNPMILHQTPLSEMAELFGNIIEEKLKGLQPQPKQELKFYTREETAEILGVSLPTLHGWTKSGTIQGSRVGSRVRYRKSDIESALQSIRNIKYKQVKP